MRAFLEKAAALNESNWHGGAYQWIFYAGIILVLIFEKRKTVRLIFAALPAAYLICIYNPLFMAAMKLAGVGGGQYFVRMFSFMPLMYTIAKGIMCLLEKTTGWIKLGLVCAVCALLCLCGSNIFGQGWYTRADNFAKVSADTNEVVEAFSRAGEKDVRVATIDPVTNYMRQTADYVTPYARRPGKLWNILSEDPPDVRKAMRTAGEQDMDYVLAWRTEATMQAFREQGYEPWALTTNLAIYKVSGVTRTRRTLNGKRQVTAVTVYDRDGNILPAEDGYSTVAYEYDSNGYRSVEKYLDENGEPYTLRNGAASVHRVYSARGLLKGVSYRDAEGNPVPVDGCYETRRDHDLSGNLTGERYYDADGRKTNRTDEHYASLKLEYDSKGRVKSERYFDTEDNPVLCSEGYAGFIREYDDRNNSIRITYLDTAGQPTVIDGGYAAVIREYDGNDYKIAERYLDTAGQPVMIDGGYAAYLREYDERGNRISEQYLDTEGNPVRRDRGYALMKREYDENDSVSREEYFDEDGRPATGPEGYHGFVRVRDDDGNILSEKYFDTEGKECLPQ